jgi:hypothetical protein
MPKKKMYKRTNNKIRGKNHKTNILVSNQKFFENAMMGFLIANMFDGRVQTAFLFAKSLLLIV